MLILLLLFITMLLGSVYIFQQTDFFGILCHCKRDEELHFAVNKIVRVLANDVLMLALIHVWFQDKEVSKLAVYIQCIDTLILLPLYLFVKLQFEGTSEISAPLLSQFHRLIINPTLMILIFPAIYFQRALQSGK